MEEDKLDFKEFKKTIKQYKAREEEKVILNINVVLDLINKIDEQQETLENLLTRYKQLEEENKKFNPELWHNEGWDRADEYWKSKIKEKIEEYKKLIKEVQDNEEHYNEIPLYEHDIEVLQELLEEE